MTETMMTKARRLPIRILQHDASVSVADVTGDHGTYRVTVLRATLDEAGRWDDPSVTCTCPATVGGCSHVLALALWGKGATMTKEHAELMSGYDAEAANELAKTCLAEILRWQPNAVAQAKGMYPNDAGKAAEFAIGQVWQDCGDYLAHSLMITLSSLRLTGWPTEIGDTT